MSPSDVPDKPSKLTPNLATSADDIPVAQRETPLPSKTVKPKAAPSPWKWIAGLGIGAIALVGGAAVAWQVQRANGGATTPAQAGFRNALNILGISLPDSSLLGHRPYDEAARDTLVPVVADGSVLLKQTAAERFIAMQQAARAEGIELAALSGFRSIEEQKYLFFGITAQQGQNVRERATVSAPPGYSEHHTGYAIDIGDASKPDTHLEASFEQTPAFQWLQNNAARYHFELSFEGGETDEVSYEPWHWRFVGDTESLELFYGSGMRSVGNEE